MKISIILGSMLSALMIGCGQTQTTTSSQVNSNDPSNVTRSSTINPPSTASIDVGRVPETSSVDMPSESKANSVESKPILAEIPPSAPVSKPDSVATNEVLTNELPADSLAGASVETAPATKPVADSSKAEPLDLTKYYRTPAAKFPQIVSYPWRDVPRGTKTLGNVPLEIGGMICLRGEINAQRGLVYPERIDGIKVARKFNALYLYHATFHSAPEGTPYVSLLFVYGDGTSDEIELEYGTHARDWYQSPKGPEELTDPKSKMVWSGVNSMSAKVPPEKLQFFMTEIANPRPDSVIETIDLVSLKQAPASCILAITTGPEGLLKVEQKADEQPKE